jgi:ABC-type uncharacterized transport system involved in gliding motility auxiliary subunit
MQLGLNSLLMVLLFLGIIGLINFLSARHPLRADLTETKQFSLAPQSVEVLEGLSRDVKLTAFVQDLSGSRSQLGDLLEQYRYYSPRIAYSFIDPDKQPAVAKQYGITQYDSMVLESGAQSALINQIVEQEITNAIIRVTKDEKRTIYFLDGHGEHRLDDKDKEGYSTVKESLEKQGFEVKPLFLFQEGAVPASADAVVASGPQRPFRPEERAALDQYLKQGGHVLLLLDPQSSHGLEELLGNWGLKLNPGIIVDPVTRLFGIGPTVPVVTTYPPHDITQEFNLVSAYPLAQSLAFDTAEQDRLEFHPLAQSGPNSWSETDVGSQRWVFNPDRDLQGPLTLAGLVTPKNPIAEEPESEPAPEPKKAVLAVFGDSDFVNNANFHFSGNGDLFLNTVSFLAQEESLISIRPKESQFAPLFLSRNQGRMLGLITLSVPVGLLVFGLAVWRRRRRL